MQPYIHKVQYYETDKMGISHHSNYVRWMEEARIDFFGQMGYGYDVMENEGIISPVLGVECKYKHTTTFADEVQIEVCVKEFNGVRLALQYNMRKKGEEEIVFTGSSEHCFLDENFKPIRMKRNYPEIYELFAKEAEKYDKAGRE